MKRNKAAGKMCRALAMVVWCAASGPLAAQVTGFKATPTTMSFNYQLGDAKLPTAQSLSVSTSSAAQATFTTVIAGGPWLTMSPASGTTPLAAKVNVNPTSLAVGTYTGTLTLTTSGSTPATVVVAVTLVVKAPPPTLTASPSPMSVTYVRGDSDPSPMQLSLSTSGGVLSYSAALAGANWLSISPKSGVVFPAFPAAVTVTVNPAGMMPGTYKASINVSAQQAANKTQTVTVNLTVNAGLPALDSIWPTQVTAGAPATTITLNGSNFFSGTVVKAGTTTLSSTLVGSNTMTAVIPASLLASSGTLGIVATNNGPGGGDSSASTFTIANSEPTINAIVNSASFLGGTVAPGEMVTIFGTGLGPETLTTFVPPTGTAPIATTLSTTRVLFDTTPAAVIYTSAGQVAAMTPYDVAGKTTVAVRVEYSTVQSSQVTMNVAQSAPGIFTAAGTGSGAAVAFNLDETSGTYTLNSDSTLAQRGTIVAFFATGEGVTTPASTDGAIVSAPASGPNSALAVTIGGQDATVLYSGGVVGLVAGLIQINTRVPLNVAPGKSVPMILTINGIQSQPNVTIGIK